MNRSRRTSVPRAGNDLLISVDRFMPVRICRQLAKIANRTHWSPSTVQSASGPVAQSVSTVTGRSSSTLMAADLGAPARRVLSKLEQSLQDAFNIEPANLEPWQLTRYKRGEAFDYHVDCGCWKNDASGERRRTILIYLQRPLRGGATHFRALNLMIQPLEGRLLLWNNLLPNNRCNYAMIHASRPVWQGCKVVLTTWEHVRRYEP